MTDLPTALAAFNTGVAMSRAAYIAETTCHDPDCHNRVDRQPNYLPILCPDCRKDRP